MLSHPLNQTPNDLDQHWMRRALQLARGSLGLASPNPQVGCVLVRDGVVLGEGAHLYDAYDHAEIVALKQAAHHGVDVSGAAAYVTLEPCSHHGRTGPCADALIQAGVSRVVAATTDPNPLVSGRGIARMQTAGIEATVGVCEREARELNDAFAKFIRTGRPLVTLKAALSADEMLAPSAAKRAQGQVHWLTGSEARTEVQTMRHSADAVLTGIGTVLADDPLLTDRSGLERRRPLLRVVLDSQIRISSDSQLVRSAHCDLLVFSASDADVGRATALKSAGVEVVQIASVDGHLDLNSVLDELGARKILGLLLECGSQLNGAFLTQKLVDKVALFYAKAELGAGAVPFAANKSGLRSTSPSVLEQSMDRVVRDPFGVDVRVSGYLRDPWAAPELG